MTEHDDLPTIATMMLWSVLASGIAAGVLVIGWALLCMAHVLEVF